ncbi:MAG: hypothetical protein IKA72_05305 [Clostridia bacterium]|nr:hypothetical protein [Clostridia bacterium]
MKKLRSICIAFLTALITVMALTGCYAINGQKMKRVKGTYKLTHYTYRPSYKSGNTPPATIDYIQDRGYEVYLVVTGTNRGYYVHKDNNTEAYSTEVDLSYEYNQEDSALVDYVYYRTPRASDTEKFGVTKNRLNYSNPGIELFGTVQAREDKDWEKVDDATDLSYVREQFDVLKEYSYDEYAMEGIYSLNSYNWESYSEETLENPYHYYFVSIDATLKKATVAYLKKDGSEAVRETKDITLLDGWRNFKTGDIEWTKDELYSGIDKYYYTVIAGEPAIKQTIVRIRQDILETTLDSLIEENTPAPSITE